MGIGAIAGKAFKVCISGIFGTGMETFSKSFRRYAFKNPTARSIFSSGGLNPGFLKNTGKAFEDVAAHETKLAAKNGGVLKNLWKQIKDIPGCFSRKISQGARIAESKGIKFFGISTKSKLLGGLKGFGKAFMKKMPLIGGIIWAATYAGDVVAAFKHGGVGAGLKEIGKSAGKLLFDVGGFMIGTACGGLIGGIVGSIAFGALGNKIFGKGYKEKMAEGSVPGGNPQVDSPAQQPPGAVPAGDGQSQIYQVIDWHPPQMPGAFAYSQYQTMPGMNSAQQNMAWTNYQSGMQPQYLPQNQLAYQMPYQTPYQMPYMPQNQMMDFCNPFSMYGLGYV